MSEIEAVEALRSRQTRYGGVGRTTGVSRAALWLKRLAATVGTGVVVTTVLHVAR